MSKSGGSSGNADMPSRRPAAVVAIPARNEAGRIGACLDALAAQVGLCPGSLGVLILVNNSTDATRAIVEARHDGFAWPLRIIERDHPAASAGWARREAMEAAAAWLEAAGHGKDGVLLTSDADSRVGRGWAARNLAAIEAGADLVGGVVEFDTEEALPAALLARAKLEACYEAMLVEIASRLDPQPGNPWPTHWSTSGASLAVRLDAYRRVGGMPALVNGEDRAFVERVRADDLVVRHDPGVVVVTSGRLEGRAVGGTADTIAGRCTKPETPCDPRLERLDHALHRVLWRARLRRLHVAGYLRADGPWAARLAVPHAVAAAACATPFAGRAVALIEATSPKLAPKPLSPAALPLQIRLARVLLACLRPWTLRRAGRPACTLTPAAAGAR